MVLVRHLWLYYLSKCKYDYCFLSWITATWLTSDRFISWRVTRVIFEYCPDLSLVLTRERQERWLPRSVRRRQDDLRRRWIRKKREHAPLSMSDHKYSGRRQQEAQTLEKACDPTVRGIVEIRFVLRKSLIADGIGQEGCKFFTTLRIPPVGNPSKFN